VHVWIADRDRWKAEFDRVNKLEKETRRDLWGRIYQLHDEYGLDRPEHTYPQPAREEEKR
jgi:hypothetical protein